MPGSKLVVGSGEVKKKEVKSRLLLQPVTCPIRQVVLSGWGVAHRAKRVLRSVESRFLDIDEKPMHVI